MAVKGVFTSVSGVSGERKGDFASGVMVTGIGGSAPMFALTSGSRSKAAVDAIVSWFDQEWMDGRVGVTNNAGTGQSLALDDASSVVANQVYMIEASGELVLVLSITGNTATVQRGFAGTTPAAINGTVTVAGIQRIGTVHEEHSNRPAAVAVSNIPEFNYCQIFRNAWEVSRTASKIDYHTENKLASSKREAAQFHAEDIERSLLFGRKSIGMKNGRRFGTMDGIIPRIVTNAETSLNGKLSWDVLDAFFEDLFRYNVKGEPNERVAHAGNHVLTVINKLARHYGTINIETGETSFGFKVARWITPHGELSFLTHPLLNASPVWRNMFFAYHPAAVMTRYLSETMIDEYNRDAGVDGSYGVYTTEMSAEFHCEKTSGVFNNILTADI